jgi:anti-anti-sigma factor
MADTASPAGREPVVVTLPHQIDMTNSSFVAGQLHEALASGAAVVIADLTATTFCDCSGIRGLLLAHHRAAAGNIQFRLTCSSPLVLRVIDLLGLTDQLAIYPSLAAALVPIPAPGGGTRTGLPALLSFLRRRIPGASRATGTGPR